MKLRNRILSAALLLSFAVTLSAPPVYAEGETAVAINPEVTAETAKTIQISYYIDPDQTFGNPGTLDYEEAIRLGKQIPSAKTVAAGEEFTLAGAMKTGSIIGVEQETGDLYVGRWVFSGWKIPDGVTVKEITVSQGGQLTAADASAGDGTVTEKSGVLPGEIQTEVQDLLSRQEAAQNEANAAGTTTYLCTSDRDVIFTGQWQFISEYPLTGAESIDAAGTYPLACGYGALTDFFPGREETMQLISGSGVLPESMVQFMDQNIRETPVQDRNFASVEISEAERVSFMNATKEVFEALKESNGNTAAVKEAIQSIVDATASDSADFGTAFVVCCADRAGLLSGKSDALIKTADLSELYAFLRNNACADFITEDELLQIYRAEDGEDTGGGVTVNNTLVDFAHGEDWYDISSRKSFILPGDLIVFKDGLGTPVSLGIIDSVEDRSITYAWCDRFGSPGENTITQNDILEMQRAGIQAEIVGLRSCDPARIIYEFLVTELNLPESSAIGVLGNLYYESKYSTTVPGDWNTSFGLCQWHNERFLNLVVFCLKNNYNVASLEGQLHFLAYELQENYTELLSELRNGETGIEASRKAAYRFCQGFEKPANLEINCALRGATAANAVWEEYYDLFMSVGQLQNMKLSDETPESIMERHARETEYVSYTVRSGDNMMSICNSFGIDYLQHQQEVNAMNNITNGSMIYVGQVLLFRRDMIKK